jgi:protein-tyrosine phosphatase
VRRNPQGSTYKAQVLKNNQLYSCALYLVPCIFALMKILMVCLGNICRSPLAEGLLQDKAWKAGLKWSVESAGTNGYHTGEAPHPLSQKVARINGVDISKQRSRRFVAEDFHRFDKIYAMSDDVIDEMRRIAKKEFDEKKVDLLLNELFPGQNVDVPDPWYGPEPGFHEVFKIINEVCDVIIKKYSMLNDQFSMLNYENPEKK